MRQTASENAANTVARARAVQSPTDSDDTTSSARARRALHAHQHAGAGPAREGQPGRAGVRLLAVHLGRGSVPFVVAGPPADGTATPRAHRLPKRPAWARRRFPQPIRGRYR